MKELVTLAVAYQLFGEARDYVSGRKPYISPESQIRVIAKAVFHQDFATHLLHVCNEIFYVLACEFQDVPR